MPRPKKKQVKKEGTGQDVLTYTATLNLLGKNYIGSGPSVAEAIKSIKIENQPKTKSILTVSDGEKEKCRILSRVVTTRAFRSGIMGEIASKQLATLFGL